METREREDTSRAQRLNTAISLLLGSPDSTLTTHIILHNLTLNRAITNINVDWGEQLGKSISRP